MILSMTGYGQVSREVGGKNYRFEIKSLNGKITDIRFKSTANLKEKELELRKLVLEKGIRGKFEVSLISEGNMGSEDFSVNKELMHKYYTELKNFSDDHALAQGDMLQSIIRMPNIVQVLEEEIGNEEWHQIKSMAIEALDKLLKFRKEEGASLEKDILSKSQNIYELLNQITEFEEERIGNIRERIMKNLNQYLSKENIDENRFEQEIVFYLEKLDINEEKVRLSQHCKFFAEEINKDNFEKGKKLSFITQEMGREINTLGAKAQHPEIQQRVVEMKDDLEKIKEQVLNIL